MGRSSDMLGVYSLLESENLKLVSSVTKANERSFLIKVGLGTNLRVPNAVGLST